jgi:LysM repeat protein
MWKWLRLLPAFTGISLGCAQTEPAAVDVANLHEDVRTLSQRVGDLSLRVDQLEAENAALREKAKSGGRDAVTLSQLNDAIAEVNRTVQAAVAAGQDDTLKQVALQMQKLTHQASAAADGSPGPSAPHGAALAAGVFSTDFPKEGINYTVQKGDTLALIAKKAGAKLSDIVNANRLADPSRIRLGQTLFIPGGK